MTTGKEMRKLQWANSLSEEDAKQARQLLSDIGWNDKRDFIPDWLAYMAELIISQGWRKT